MNIFAYAYAITNSHHDKRLNVFRMKEVERIIMSNPKEMK
jgi:hypothetical protein